MRVPMRAASRVHTPAHRLDRWLASTRARLRERGAPEVPVEGMAETHCGAVSGTDDPLPPPTGLRITGLSPAALASTNHGQRWPAPALLKPMYPTSPSPVVRVSR